MAWHQDTEHNVAMSLLGSGLLRLSHCSLRGLMHDMYALLGTYICESGARLHQKAKE